MSWGPGWNCSPGLSDHEVQTVPQQATAHRIQRPVLPRRWHPDLSVFSTTWPRHMPRGGLFIFPKHSPGKKKQAKDKHKKQVASSQVVGDLHLHSAPNYGWGLGNGLSPPRPQLPICFRNSCADALNAHQAVGANGGEQQWGVALSHCDTFTWTVSSAVERRRNKVVLLGEWGLEIQRLSSTTTYLGQIQLSRINEYQEKELQIGGI